MNHNNTILNPITNLEKKKLYHPVKQRLLQNFEISLIQIYVLPSSFQEMNYFIQYKTPLNMTILVGCSKNKSNLKTLYNHVLAKLVHSAVLKPARG